MAGFYPDVPAPRMAYDRDGTALLQVYAGGSTQLAQSSLENINSDNNSAIYSAYANNIPPRQFVLIFPQHRDIHGYFSAIYTNWTSSNIQTSPNSTNGIDGNWTTQTSVPNRTSVSVAYRTSITAVNWTNVKAIKIGWYSTSGSADTASFSALHLFGVLSNFTGVDGLRIWHPTLDEPLDDAVAADGAWFDFGDAARNTSAERQFRVKNNSTGLTANSINVTSGTLTDASPSVPPQFTFSDGGAFTTSLNIGNLAPGAISPTITYRRTTPSNAALSLWTVRIMCEPLSWT